MSLCKACGKPVEEHLTAAGRPMPIDPEPHPLGDYYFDHRIRLVWARPRTKEKMYRSHMDTCAKKGQALRRAPTVRDDCARWDCDRTDRHAGHCHRCGSTEHFAAECPEER